MDKREELIRAVGFFNGEGSTAFSRTGHRGKYGAVEICVGQTDPRELRRFARAIAIGKIYGPYQTTNGRPGYQWRVASLQARIFLKRVWPWLSSAKREQAKAALQKAGQWPISIQRLNTRRHNAK